jgi:hypothetical protein
MEELSIEGFSPLSAEWGEEERPRLRVVASGGDRMIDDRRCPLLDN